MGKLQISRFERLAARTYSIKGPGALVDLDETVLGVIQLERQGGPESWLMQGWESFDRLLSISAAGGAFSWVLLSNPPDSGRLLVVDGWQRNDASRMRMYITRGVPPGFSVAGPGIGLDTRIPQLRQSTGVTYQQTNAISDYGTGLVETASVEFQADQPIVLAPDGSCAWRGGVFNETLTIGFRWAERDAQPFELQ
ncbi:MAG TPA: hypothetical protein EYO33_19795 [Phycisphaerales bacterium]|jgi:hypothetical protein|nr:hypothetical protein [Phycisphaerales bacterium]